MKERIIGFDDLSPEKTFNVEDLIGGISMLQVILTKIAIVLLAIIVIGLIISFSKDSKMSHKVDDLYEDERTGRIYKLKGKKRIYL